MKNTLLRTKRDGVFKNTLSQAWGAYWAKVDDPEANETNDLNQSSFKLIENFPKIPADLWSAVIKLYFDHAKNKNEVQVLLLRDEDTLSHWKIVVPRQEVTGTSVDSYNFNDCCDLITGEKYTVFPPEGYIHTGSSHSHHVLKLADFSSIDDKNELSVNGAHILVSNVNFANMEYIPTASIVLRKRRYYLPAEKVIDLHPMEVAYHPNVNNYIKLKVFPKYNFNKQLQSKEKYILSKDLDKSLECDFFDKEVQELLYMGLTPQELKRRIDTINDNIWSGF